jgi:hypothetical protein
MLWMVIFGAANFHNFTHIGEVVTNRFPHLRDLYLREKPFYIEVGGGSALTELRYTYDLAEIEQLFQLSPNGFRGKRVVEIGCGYGGFAHTFSAAHELLSYHMVDMAPSLEFQQRYLSLLDAVGSGVGVPYISVPDTNTRAVPSDLLVSFMAIDEVPEEDLVRYIAQYVAQASRGYLRLAASRAHMLKVFELVWSVQPSALMLPPDVGCSNFGAVNERGQGLSVRVIWDNTEGRADRLRYTWN